MEHCIRSQHPALGPLVTLQHDITVGRVLREGKVWEPHLIEAFRKHITNQPGVILDCGAFYSTHAMHLAASFTKAQVISFEPMPMHYKCSLENLGPCRNACVVPAALGARCGLVQIPHVDYGLPANYGGTQVGDAIGGNGPVPLESMSWAPMLTIDSLDLADVLAMKVDVECSEIDLLQGGLGTLARYKPPIFIEIWKQQMQAFKASNTWLKMVAMGYTMQKIAGDDFLLLCK